MFDKRLIDYSIQYADYRDTLKERGKNIELEDLMCLLEGFLLNCDKKMFIYKDKAAVQQLIQAQNLYIDS